MASLPPQRPASQRRASPPPESASQQPVARTDSFSAHSVDSQTLLLNPPQSQATQPTAPNHIEEAIQNPAPPEEYELKRCWICFNDESEDDETTSEWRSPCTCTLVAHEKCLLDWIADMEAPNSRRRAGKRASKVECPQCKTEIRIQRPRSVVVETVRTVERLTSFLVIPGLAFVTATAACSALSLAGTHTIYQIFGTEDALQILGPLYELPDPRMVTPMTRFLTHLRHHWRLDIGLPLIPTVLIASRTTFADSFLPFLPLIFFVSSGRPGDEMLQLQWPPSAAFSFAALPYLRGFYNAFYERVCLPREQQWLKEIQPRAGTDEEGDENVNHNNNEDVQEIQIEVDLDLFDDWNDNGDAENHEALDNPPVPVPREPARPADAPPAAAVVADPPARRRIRRDRTVSAGSVIDTILGSLLFPSIAAAMGELLNRTLPTSWVTPPKGAPATSWLGGWVAAGGRPGATGKPTGFLQTRWGRSIIGGCMFVGLKDMVLLYVRWRVAQNHRKRRIMDCDPELKKAKRGTSTTS